MRTRLRTGVVVAVLAAILAAPAFSTGTTAGQPPKDVKGWHGTEWGMTPEQVATIIGVPPFEPIEDEKDETLSRYTLPKFSVGVWVVEVDLQFGRSGSSGLARVSLDFGDRSFKSVADKLRGDYGPATALIKTRGGLETASWEFPSTDILCLRIPRDAGIGDKPFVTVQYTPHRKSIGTWKLNFAKSRALSTDNGPASVSSTITNEVAGAGVKCTVDVVSAADGTLGRFEFRGKYDGKDNAIKGDTQYGDVVALTRVDASTTRYIYKKGGTVTVTQTHVVSSDGKTMTVTSAGTDAKGTPISSVAVYDKQ